MKIDRVEPNSGLRDIVLSHINLEKRRIAKIRLTYTSIIGVISLITLFPMIQYFINDFLRSGFYQYLSLLFSDGNVAITYWKEFSLSLLESLPAISITMVLVLVFILLGTLKFIIQDSKIIFNKIKLA